MKTLLVRIPLLLMLALASFLVVTVSPYWNFETQQNFLLVKQHLVSHPIWMPVFYVHLAAGTLSILIGALQLFPYFQKKQKLHKPMGRTYGYAILLLGFPTGVYMSFFAEGGWLSTLGFLIMSVLWFGTTLIAIQKARQGRIIEHKEWMYRSYAMTFSAVTLRLLVPLLSYFLHWDHMFVIIITAWISWGLNLIVAETVILYGRLKRKRIHNNHIVNLKQPVS